MLSADTCPQNTVQFITQEGKQSFTYLLDVRKQHRDYTVCYLLCSSKSWYNGGSIKHKKNSQLSRVARTLWKDLDHRKISCSDIRKSGNAHNGFPPNQQNLRTPACKLYQLLLAQLKSSPPPRSNPQRLLLPLADKVEGNGCYYSATVVNHNKVI